jgi:hypothetical protein
VPLSLAHLDVAAEPGVAVHVELEVVVVALDGDGLVGGIRGRRGGLGRRGGFADYHGLGAGRLVGMCCREDEQQRKSEAANRDRDRGLWHSLRTILM